MTTSPLTLTPAGGASMKLTSARVWHFFQGAWLVDCELDPESVVQTGMPSGRVALSVGGVSMSGAIDPEASGTFGPRAMARVVAGAGGWDSIVPAQDFSADNGLTTTQVYQATALTVGETVKDLAPSQVGVKFERTNGPASRVFRDSPWWVDVTGVTNVGARPSSTPDASLVVREWDPIRQRVTFSCDTLLFPNSTISDERFNGDDPTVFDVEQLFDANGSIGWAWETPGACSQLVANLKSAGVELGRLLYRTIARYRLIQYQGAGPGGGPSRLALQAVNRSLGVPDIIPIFPFAGAAGLTQQLAPSQEVLVGFEDANPALPRILSYSQAGLPVSTTLDASASLKIGPSAPDVELAGGANTLVPTPWGTGLAAALATFCAALTTPPVTTVAQIVTAAGALATALGALPSPATERTKAT